jgi:hypothetical protein
MDAGGDTPLLLPDGDAGDVVRTVCAILTPPSGPVAIENQGNLRYLEVPVIAPAGSDASPSMTWGTIIDVNSFTNGSNQLWNFQPVSDDSGSYRIVNSLSSDCIDVVGASTSNGTGLQQYGCFNQTNQHFVVCSSDGGSVQIMGQQSGKCLTSVGNKDNAPVYIYDCSSSVTQQWTLAQ